jgi:hypothetical protein
MKMPSAVSNINLTKTKALTKLKYLEGEIETLFSMLGK